MVNSFGAECCQRRRIIGCPKTALQAQLQKPTEVLYVLPTVVGGKLYKGAGSKSIVAITADQTAIDHMLAPRPLPSPWSVKE